MKKCYISVDIEASVGFKLPPVSSMISIGACVIDQPNKQFYAELVPINANWDPKAQEIHQFTRAHLCQHGLFPAKAMVDFQRWTREVSIGMIPVFCAMPVRYDWGFVDWYFTKFGVTNPFTETLDGFALYRQAKKIPEDQDVHRVDVEESFPTSLPHSHNALADALEQGDRFRQMLKLMGEP